MSLGAWGDGGDEDHYASEDVSEREGEAFVKGLQAMREMLARFVEQGGNAEIANSIRLNWRPDWGDDPGQPEDIATSYDD